MRFKTSCVRDIRPRLVSKKRSEVPQLSQWWWVNNTVCSHIRTLRIKCLLDKADQVWEQACMDTILEEILARWVLQRSCQQVKITTNRLVEVLCQVITNNHNCQLLQLLNDDLYTTTMEHQTKTLTHLCLASDLQFKHQVDQSRVCLKALLVRPNKAQPLMLLLLSKMLNRHSWHPLSMVLSTNLWTACRVPQQVCPQVLLLCNKVCILLRPCNSSA